MRQLRRAACFGERPRYAEVVTVTLALSVRRFRQGDEGFITRLARKAFAEYSNAPGYEAVHMALSNPTLVATEGATPIGFVTVEPERNSGTAYVIALAVAEDRRSRGVGYGLLCAAERLARMAQARSVQLHTADFNLVALELFLRSGYVITRRLPRYYRGRFNACELEKRL
jgi:ribosomal protein S18 acetylase RimI-like enzyme